MSPFWPEANTNLCASPHLLDSIHDSRLAQQLPHCTATSTAASAAAVSCQLVCCPGTRLGLGVVLLLVLLLLLVCEGAHAAVERHLLDSSLPTAAGPGLVGQTKGSGKDRHQAI